MSRKQVPRLRAQVPRSFRFPARLRLKTRRQFLRAQNQGDKLHVSRFLVFAIGAACADSEEVRLGITVTRKVGHAVMRNRVKRWVREAFRRERHRFPPGLDLVFVAKRQVQRSSYQEVLQDVQRAAALLARRCANSATTPVQPRCSPQEGARSKVDCQGRRCDVPPVHD